jgi:hypothetical protein
MENQQAKEVISDCARMRAEQQDRPMTIREAIDKVRWCQATPDGIFDPIVAKRVMSTLLAALERSRCYYNATLRGQEVFVLVQQDRAAPAAIVAWADEAEAHGCKSEKVTQAYQLSGRWNSQPADATKWPD